VKHTLLALAAGYGLYYAPSEALQVRANYHYRRATDLLTAAIADPQNSDPGHDDSVVASLLLLFIDDVSIAKSSRSSVSCGILLDPMQSPHCL
jgi:hypothetical protein